MSDKLICGRRYTVVKTVDLHPPSTFFMQTVQVVDEDGKTAKKKVKKERKSFYIKPKPKIIVEGINHPKKTIGDRPVPIRFKSLQRAENYIKNFRLEIKEAA